MPLLLFAVLPWRRWNQSHRRCLSNHNRNHPHNILPPDRSFSHPRVALDALSVTCIVWASFRPQYYVQSLHSAKHAVVFHSGSVQAPLANGMKKFFLVSSEGTQRPLLLQESPRPQHKDGRVSGVHGNIWGSGTAS